MDVVSYLLGKNASGGGGGGSDAKIKPATLQFGSSAGATIHTELIDASEMNSFEYMFTNCICEEIDLSTWNNTKVTKMRQMFSNCSNLKTVKIGSGLDTSHVTRVDSMFNGCSSLENIPAFNLSSVTNMSSMFTNVGSKLTDESLNNILLTCISATSFTGTKKIRSIGIGANFYPTERIETLPSYQAFLNAGWTIE